MPVTVQNARKEAPTSINRLLKNRHVLHPAILNQGKALTLRYRMTSNPFSNRRLEE